MPDTAKNTVSGKVSFDALLESRIEELLFAEVFDAVADLGGAFEFQFFRGFEHLLFQPLDGFFQGFGSGSEEFCVFAFRFGDFEVVEVIDIGEARDDQFLHGLRRDVVLLVVFELFRPAAVGLFYAYLHRAGHFIGVEDDLAFDVPRGAPDGLDKRDA